MKGSSIAAIFTSLLCLLPDGVVAGTLKGARRLSKAKGSKGKNVAERFRDVIDCGYCLAAVTGQADSKQAISQGECIASGGFHVAREEDEKTESYCCPAGLVPKEKEFLESCVGPEETTFSLEDCKTETGTTRVFVAEKRFDNEGNHKRWCCGTQADMDN